MKEPPKGLRMCNLIGEPLQANVLEHIEDIILNIKDHYETFAVVPRGKSKLQVYMTISNGTNGAEGCIINSMEDVLNVLKNLRKYKGVNWSQLLEVGIDNADDLYWWYVTFSIDTTAIWLNEQLNQYYSKDADKKQCWVSKDNCPLKELCNGLVKPECKEHISNEEACHAIDKMIEWYYQVEEPEFLKFYNCHLEMLEWHGRN